MGKPNSDTSYRLELMRLRERVSAAKQTYRLVAVLSTILAIGSFFGSDSGFRVPVTVIAALVSVASIMAYRDQTKRPRLWPVISLALWVVPIAVGFLAGFIGTLYRVSLGELEWTAVMAEGGFDLVRFLYWVLLGWGLWVCILKRGEIALIEEHRDEWDSYASGRSFRSKGTAKSEPSPEAASQS